MAQAHKTLSTTDHQTIRRWAEERGGKPTAVRGTGGRDDPGILRIDFPHGGREQELAEISWDEWFRKFDEAELQFLYKEQTDGGEKSNFNKILSRESGD